LTRDNDEAGPSGTVKKEPSNGRYDPYEQFSQHFRRIERCERQ
jgi:hypothetical protein